MERDAERRAGLRAAALVGTGMTAAAALALVERGCVDPGPSRRPPVVWVADRGARAAFGLDEELFVTRRVALAHPVALAPAGGGRFWALCAVDGWRDGAHRLELRSPEGELLSALPAEGPARLVAIGDGGVALVPAALDRPWRAVGADGAEHPLPPRRRGRAIAASGGELALADEHGRVRTFAGGRELARSALGGAVLELASGRAGGGWWALVDRDDGRRLVRLGPGLEERWRIPWRSGEALLAPLPDGERAWGIDRDEGALALLSRRGLELRRADPALRDALAARTTPAGELLVATPGALLRFDRRGRRLPGQGGFDRLADVALVGRGPP